MWAWNPGSGVWTASSSLTGLASLVAGGGNFAGMTGNRVYTWQPALPIGTQSPQFIGLAEVLASDGNFSERLSTQVWAYDAASGS